jgi:competence protein CoiA
MPFIALHKETKDRIDITTINNPRQFLKSGDCICQLCEKPMIVKAGQVLQPHFAHQASCPNSEYQSQPESPEHRAAKRYLAEHLVEEFPEYVEATIEYEVPIPEVRRIADLLATWPSGHKKAHEIQLSGITTEILQKRTDDYEHAGIDIVWWLGKSAFTKTNADWSLQTFGVCYCIGDFEDTKSQVNRGYSEVSS